MTATRPTADPTDLADELALAAYLNRWPLVTEDEARAELGLAPVAEEDR